LIAGGITDLNVMTRRGRFSHRVRRVEVLAPTTLPVVAWATLIVCSAGRVLLGSTSLQLGPLDTLMLEPFDATVALAAEPRASIIVVELDQS